MSFMAQTAQTIHPDLGLDDSARMGIVNILRSLLADQHILYMKLRKYHWNVTGLQFHALHLTFEEQYTQLGIQIDETAEKVREYGAFPQGTFAEMIELSRLSETPGENPSARQMLSDLVADHETIIRALRHDIDVIDDDYDDVAAEDFLTGLLHSHQKSAWMLRATIEDE